MSAPILEHYLVTQSNSLIEARPVINLTKNEQKLILTMLSLIQPLDEDFKEYSINIHQFSELLGLKETNHSFVSEVKNMVKSIMEKTIEIPKEDGSFLLLHWVTKAEYVKKTHELRVRFEPELKPYLLQLKSAFTQYQLSNILKLSSSFSIRMYELLKKNEDEGKWDVDLDELRILIGATKTTYQRYFEFKVKVLNKVMEELNQKTDILVDFYESEKIGRRVKRLCFTIQKNKLKESISTEWLSKKEFLVSFIKHYPFKNIVLTEQEIEQIVVMSLAVWIYEETEYIQNELKLLFDFVDKPLKNDIGKLYIYEQLDFGLLFSEFSVSFKNIHKRKDIIVKNKAILNKFKDMDVDLFLLIVEKTFNQVELKQHEIEYWNRYSQLNS